jgi:hypothetical protein
MISPTGSDELDRLFSRLVQNLAELDPSRLHRPFPVSELHEHLVPYRTHRVQLGFETHEDYEMTILRLLAGERGYASVEPPEVGATLAREAASVNPNTSLYRQYGAARVHLDPDRVGEALGGAVPATDEEAPADLAPQGREAAAGSPAGATLEVLSEDDEEEVEEAQGQLPFALAEEEDEPAAAAPRTVRGPSAPCAYCGGELPVGRTVLFCPHCGQNVGVVHCPACGTELDVGWKFCISCGARMTGLG